MSLIAASSIEAEPVRWAWEGRVPLGGLTVLAGQQGLGKSTLTLEMAARITRGELPGDLFGSPSVVLVITAEDHLGSVVRPRLEAAGADLALVKFIAVTHDGADGLVSLPEDVDAIGVLASEHHPRLLVIDPIVATLGRKIDGHKDQDVRRALAPVAQLAERQDLAAVAVMHLNKNQTVDVLNRVSGSVAFTAAARSMLAFARDPDDPEGDRGNRRVLVPVKTNWGRFAPSLACRLDTIDMKIAGQPVQQPVLVITGECDTTAADLSRRGGRGARGEAEEFLHELLEGQEWVAAGDVRAAAEEIGHSWRTVQRAAELLRVERRRDGFPARSLWHLPVAPKGSGATADQDRWRDCETPGLAGDPPTDESSHAIEQPAVVPAGKPGTDDNADPQPRLFGEPPDLLGRPPIPLPHWYPRRAVTDTV